MYNDFAAPLKLIRHTREEFVDHFSTALFARVLCWGHKCYNEKIPDYYLPEVLGTNTDSDDDIPSTNASAKKNCGLIGKINSTNFPANSEIAEKLKRSILDLDDPEFALLQSILSDMYVLQEFSQPLSARQYDEETKQRMQQVDRTGRSQIMSANTAFFRKHITALRVGSQNPMDKVKRPIQTWQETTPKQPRSGNTATSTITKKKYAKRQSTPAANVGKMASKTFLPADELGENEEDNDDDEDDHLSFAKMQSNVAEKQRYANEAMHRMTIVCGCKYKLCKYIHFFTYFFNCILNP